MAGERPGSAQRRSPGRSAAALLPWIAAASLGACQPILDAEALRDPRSCAGCHPDHYREWSGSMHAYASTDPVFLAMNARGQRETGGALGDFCVRCHAPLAVALGATTDGLNLPELGADLQGIGCGFCHSVEAVEGTHNNPLALASDGVMRGPIADPEATRAHRSAYSPLHDRDSLDSAALCGSCHDIVTPAGVPLERTYQEWLGTLFAHDDPFQRLTCGGCHMDGRDGEAATGGPERRVHGHTFAGVDVALVDFPEAEPQRRAIQDQLDTVLFADLCVTLRPEGWRAEVTLENVAAGHSWPSGAAHDRRAWVEVAAWSGDQAIFRSGEVADGQPVVEVEADDPTTWVLRDRVYDSLGEPAHMFWDVASYESELLPGPTALSPTDPQYTDTHVSREYALGAQAPTRVEVAVHLRPFGLDVIDDLIDSGDLDPVYRERIPTFTLEGGALLWTEELGRECVDPG